MATIRDHSGKRVTFRASNRTLIEAANATMARMPPEAWEEPDDLRVFDYRAKEPRWETVIRAISIPIMIAIIPGFAAGFSVWLAVVLLLFALPALVTYRLGAGVPATGTVALVTLISVSACHLRSRRVDLVDDLLRLGLCGACGYELEPAEGSLTTCPECGAAWRKHVKAQDTAPQPPDGTSD